MTDDNAKFFFGVHFMVDGYNAPAHVLSDHDALASALADIPLHLGMHPISKPHVVEVGPNNKKDPGGLSGFVMIAESHLSFHTFPARGFVTADIYTCKEDIDTDAVLSELRNVFKFADCETHVVHRGRNYPKNDIYKF